MNELFTLGEMVLFAFTSFILGCMVGVAYATKLINRLLNINEKLENKFLND